MSLYVTLELNFNFFNWNIVALGLPWWLRVKESACQCRSCGFNPWVGKIPWRRKWPPTPVFQPAEFPWTEEPGRLQSMGSQNSRTQLSN